MARVAQKSSVRAYKGSVYTKHVHNRDLLREIFSHHNLNLTHFARSFGLYKESLGVKTDKTSYDEDF